MQTADAIVSSATQGGPKEVKDKKSDHAQEELNREFQAAAELTRSLKAGGQEETVIIVSNSTPLIALARIGSLDLLKSLFTTITIPQTVYHEVVTSGPTRPSAQAVGAANWIVTRAVTNRRAVTQLMNSASLDRGESEAILIALELKAS